MDNRAAGMQAAVDDYEDMTVVTVYMSVMSIVSRR